MKLSLKNEFLALFLLALWPCAAATALLVPMNAPLPYRVKAEFSLVEGKNKYF